MFYLSFVYEYCKVSEKITVIKLYLYVYQLSYSHFKMSFMKPSDYYSSSEWFDPVHTELYPGVVLHRVDAMDIWFL